MLTVLPGINKYGKGGAVQISTVLNLFTMLLLEGSSETELFRHLSNHVFPSPKVKRF